MSTETANTTSIASLFSQAKPSTRLFIWLRWRFTPYLRIASVLPRRGRVLDLGSGHGLLSLALCIDSGEREIIGIDHDPERVRLAEGAISRHACVSKPRFQVGDLEKSLATIPSGSLAGIAMVDLLHYFDPDGQRALIEGAARALAPGGILAMREIDSEGGAAAVWNKVYENVSTRVGFTRSAIKRLEFRSLSGWTKMLEGAGFRVQSEPCGPPIFSDVLFIGRRSP
jgi:SAM-dependent methyltransferase